MGRTAIWFHLYLSLLELPLLIVYWNMTELQYQSIMVVIVFNQQGQMLLKPE
jgi:hypothetical protein